MAKSSRVYWTEQQKDHICEMTLKRFMNHPHESMLTSLNKIQKQMPENQRRNIITISIVPWLVTYIKEQLNGYLTKEYQVEEQIKNGIKANEDRLHKELEESRQSIINHAIAEMTAEDALALFIDKAKRQIQGEFQKSITSIMSDLKSEITANIKSSQSSQLQAIKLPKIIVIGLRGNQIGQVQNKYHGRLDIRFVNSNQSEKNLPTDATIFLMTKFLGHDWINMANSQRHKTDVIHCGGGLSNLYKKINEHQDGR